MDPLLLKLQSDKQLLNELIYYHFSFNFVIIELIEKWTSR